MKYKKKVKQSKEKAEVLMQAVLREVLKEKGVTNG